MICTLIEKNLAFRGSNESFGKESNGNFIGLLELISKFDPFLSEHVEYYGNVGSGKTNYHNHMTTRQTCLENIKV